MPRGIHYSDEQKEEMRAKAQRLLEQGKKKKKDVCQEINVTPPTLNKLLGEQPKRAKRASAAPAGPHVPSLPGLDSDNPVVQLAVKHQRIQAIDREVKQLAEEKARLEEEMKALYKRGGRPTLRQPQEVAATRSLLHPVPGLLALRAQYATGGWWGEFNAPWCALAAGRMISTLHGILAERKDTTESVGVIPCLRT